MSGNINNQLVQKHHKNQKIIVEKKIKKDGKDDSEAKNKHVKDARKQNNHRTSRLKK